MSVGLAAAQVADLAGSETTHLLGGRVDRRSRSSVRGLPDRRAASSVVTSSTVFHLFGQHPTGTVRPTLRSVNGFCGDIRAGSLRNKASVMRFLCTAVERETALSDCSMAPGPQTFQPAGPGLGLGSGQTAGSGRLRLQTDCHRRQRHLACWQRWVSPSAEKSWATSPGASSHTRLVNTAWVVSDTELGLTPTVTEDFASGSSTMRNPWEEGRGDVSGRSGQGPGKGARPRLNLHRRPDIRIWSGPRRDPGPIRSLRGSLFAAVTHHGGRGHTASFHQLLARRRPRSRS